MSPVRKKIQNSFSFGQFHKTIPYFHESMRMLFRLPRRECFTFFWPVCVGRACRRRTVRQRPAAAPFRPTRWPARPPIRPSRCWPTPCKRGWPTSLQRRTNASSAAACRRPTTAPARRRPTRPRLHRTDPSIFCSEAPRSYDASGPASKRLAAVRGAPSPEFPNTKFRYPMPRIHLKKNQSFFICNNFTDFD